MDNLNFENEHLGTGIANSRNYYYHLCCNMIISGLFTAISYKKMEVQNHLMKICLVINSLYSIFGIAILGDDCFSNSILRKNKT